MVPLEVNDIKLTSPLLPPLKMPAEVEKVTTPSLPLSKDSG